jgi:hypothetical protein
MAWHSSEPRVCGRVSSSKHAWCFLQLIDGDAELGEPDRYCPGNPGFMVPKDPGAKAASPRVLSPEMPAPAISVSAAPCGASPTPGTSVANIAAYHLRMTEANKDP